MLLSRRKFVGIATAAISSSVLSNKVRAATAPGRKPNIVFLFADQMRASSMGCMGNDQVKTPKLDKLATEGLLLKNMIASQPVCTPYRGQLMTGRYGHTTGVKYNDCRLPDNEKVVSTQLKKAGYATGYIGKWHLAGSRKNPVDKVNRRDWDFWAVRNCSHNHFNPEYWLNDSEKSIKVKGWEPDIQTDLAVEYIKKNKQHPFCLFVSYGPPHNPYKAPEAYLKRYDVNTLKDRPNGSLGKKITHNYYAMVSNLDDCTERINQTLIEAGISEHSILIFTSDHGDMLGSQGHTLKQRPWEESINVPFILKYPAKVKAGQVKDWIVSSVDIMPTLLGFAGAEIPDAVQGMDYSPTFIGKSTKERKEAFILNIDPGGKSGGPGCDWRGIRTKDWTYAYHGLGDWILYNNIKDPYQMKNLINDPESASKKKALMTRLESLRKEYGDTLELVKKGPSTSPKKKVKKKPKK